MNNLDHDVDMRGEGKGQYELLKDIVTPNGYWRAGVRKDREDWEREFPRAFLFHNDDEWFFDHAKSISPMDMGGDKDIAAQVVKEIFELRHLKSISYGHAAIEARNAFKRKYDIMELSKLSSSKVRLFSHPVFYLCRPDGFYLKLLSDQLFHYVVDKKEAKLFKINEAVQIIIEEAKHGNVLELAIIDEFYL